MIVDKKEQGKKNKRAGAMFERKVRAYLEERGWIVSKWQNTVKEGKIVAARPGRFRMMQTGFPDFIIYRPITIPYRYHVNFVECKVRGYLSKEEKAMADLYLERNICGQFWVAYKGPNGEVLFKTVKGG